MRALRRAAALTGVLVAFATIPATASYAPAPGFNSQLRSTAQAGIVVMNRDQGTVSLVPNIGLTGNARDFCLLLPTPTVPTLEPVGQPIWWEALNLTGPETVRLAKKSYGCGIEKRSLPPAPGYQDDIGVILGQTVGPFEAVVLEASNVNALAQWLIDHKYTMAIKDLNLFASYLERGWVVTAMRLDTTQVQLPERLDVNVAPVRFTFAAEEWELPLSILAVGRAEYFPVAYFVIDDHRMTLPGFTTTYANALSESEVRAVVDLYPNLGPFVSAGRILTRLDHTFLYDDPMDASLVLERAEDDAEYRRSGLSWSSVGGLPALLLGLGSMLVAVRAGLRRRFG